MIWTMCTVFFHGKIGGATTFASAKVKNATGRIGIFDLRFHRFPFYRNSNDLVMYLLSRMPFQNC